MTIKRPPLHLLIACVAASYALTRIRETKATDVGGKTSGDGDVMLIVMVVRIMVRMVMMKRLMRMMMIE